MDIEEALRIMVTNNLQNPDNPKKLIGERNVYIWGARHEGYATRLALTRHDIHTTGYIDSSPSLAGTSAFGLSVTNPSIFFAEESPQKAFIIVASGFFADEISDSCLAEGWRKNTDFIVYGELRRFNYQVDVTGMCNLRCISCPRGNWPRHREPGFMSAKTYESLVDKILRDDPWTGIITLYNWGEPLLNPALPDIINITREKGLLSAVSSNLAMTKDFENVVKAGPDWFRISNSGWGSNYETTHTGAHWDIFHANCRKLSEYRQRYSQDMIIEFFFHIYEHNRQDFAKIQSLCNELGFILRYRHAALAPLDNIEFVIDGKPLTDAAIETRKLQFLSVEEVMDIARAEQHRPCFYMDHLWIDWNLSVAHCMEWYDPALKLFDKDFMSVTLDDIDNARIGSEHCQRCMKKGIHRAYSVYGDEKLVATKSSIPVQKEE
jgi:MoaA/NifB/PqqE/SkfB family radical SAM enzyme